MIMPRDEQTAYSLPMILLQFSDPNFLARSRPFLYLNMGEDKVIPVKVAVRIRPLNDKEHGEGCQAVLEQVKGEPQVCHLKVKGQQRHLCNCNLCRYLSLILTR